jgi:hypothetical protein
MTDLEQDAKINALEQQVANLEQQVFALLAAIMDIEGMADSRWLTGVIADAANLLTRQTRPMTRVVNAP